MIAADDPAFGELREYLIGQEGTDFDTARSIVFMSRHLVEAFGRSTTTASTSTWNMGGR